MRNYFMSQTVRARRARGFTVAAMFFIAGGVFGATPRFFNGLSILALILALVSLAIGLRLNSLDPNK